MPSGEIAVEVIAGEAASITSRATSQYDIEVALENIALTGTVPAFSSVEVTFPGPIIIPAGMGLTANNLPAGSTLTLYESMPGVYPVRPTARTDITVVWTGTVAPAKGGAYAIDGIDKFDQIT